MATSPFFERILASLAGVFIHAGLSKAKPTLARRKVSAGQQLDIAFLRKELEQVLNIICKKDSNLIDGIKNNLLAYFSQIDALYDKPFIQEWLNYRETRDLFIDRTIASLLEKDVTVYDNSLMVLYSRFSGEFEVAASYIINITSDYLIHSIYAILDDSR
jgi:hypothetical protein